MALQLDVELAGLASGAASPPRRMQELVLETGGFKALSHFAGKAGCAKSQAEEGLPPDCLWQRLFSDPTHWWDSRRSKPTSRHLDLKHKTSKVALWPNNGHKPAWPDGWLATWDPGPPESVFAPGEGQGASAANEGPMEVEMCDKLCEDGLITDAADALNLLVQRGYHVHNNLFYRLLKRCITHKDLVLGRRIHALTVGSGYEGDAFLATHLIGLYASHGRLEEAMQVFSKVSTPSAYNWASIIFAYARHGEAAQAIRLYKQMRESTVKPDNRIYVAILKACGAAGDLIAGKEVHAHILAAPEQPDIFVQTGLLAMYGKCGSLEDAHSVFVSLSQRDVVTWNAIIGAYAQQGMGQEAFNLYNSMLQEGLNTPNSATFVCLLQACASMGAAALDDGKHLHAQIEERGLQNNVVLGCSLINMYAKCGSLDDARIAFDRLPIRNVLAWTAMIAGYAQQGMGQEALNLYSTMQVEGLCPPNSVTFVCLLQACASAGVGALHEGKQLRAQIEKQGLQHDVVVGGSLVNMYAKCGSLRDARRFFDELPYRNIVAWNAMIAGYAQQGMGQEALIVYRIMQQESLSPPDSATLTCLLQACASVGVGALHEGRQLHAQIDGRGLLQHDVLLGASLVNMYVRCGTVEDARTVFDTVRKKNIVTWNAMLGGYAQQGMGQKALRLYSSMQHEGLSAPTCATFVCLLGACASSGLGALHEGQQLHAQIEGYGLHHDVVLATSLINMYAKCGGLMAARSVFDKLPERNVVTWTAMIAAYAQQEMALEALSLYTRMQQEGLSPDYVTYKCLLQACANVGVAAVHEGKLIHAQIEKQGLQDDLILGCSLIKMYTKCGSVDDGRRVFDRLSHKNVVIWTTMIAGYAKQGMSQEALNLYNSMQQVGLTPPNSVTFVCLLRACASIGASALHEGKQLHAEIREQRLQDDVVLGCSLIKMYTQCGSLEDARSVFDKLPDRNVVTWTAMFAGYAQQGMGQETLTLYRSMQQEGLCHPDSATFKCLLQACANMGVAALHEGRLLHARIEKQGLHCDVVLGCSLVNMYVKCGSLQDARTVFDRLPDRNVVTWTTLIAGYAQQRMGQEALSTYAAMQQEGLSFPDSVTFTCLLQACASLGVRALHEGKQLHAQIEKQGLEDDVVVGGSLVNMYAKCASLEEARCVFDRLPNRNVVTWNAMLGGYSQQGMAQEAFSLFNSMQQEAFLPPDSLTFVFLLQACATVGGLAFGKQLHGDIQKRGMQANVVVGAALINMYAKCGSMFESQQVFDSLPERTIEAWGALIGGYTRQGDSEVVFDLLNRMRLEGTAPNGITFLSVLSVCSHVGLVDKGRKYFEVMRRDYGICPTIEHYACMMDLLGRAGHLEEALQMVKSMPCPSNGVFWHTLLGACQKWNDVEIGQQAFECAVKLDGEDAASYVLMSNIYARAQMWDEAKEMQPKRVKRGAGKKPGQSWYGDMGGVVQGFALG